VTRIVVDPRVVVSGLLSRQGASFRLLSAIGRGTFEIALSVPLVLEYEDTLERATLPPLGRGAVADLLDYFCKVAHHQPIFLLWRPRLPDPKDDMVLELAVAARAETIVTDKVRVFAAAQKFGVSVLEPAPFLARIGVTP